ncbi:MAG TPA: undecaprenyl-diphosphate phosphatase [Ferruginibacter sp.]|nr:undecaprenyl-diphosphate phosphatase [Ferruginibacter sp.]HRE62170.1 undecaprenyl-diphosphate phosphatase [Ferruginibacter sp.]
MNIFQAIVTAIVEGLTEFIPVSSTGHMIITNKLMGVPDNEFTKMFTVAIQLGAILAVVVLYHKKFFDFKNIRFYLKLLVGVIPAMVLGFLLGDKIDAMLESTQTVAWALLGGGIVLLFIDSVFKNPTVDSEKNVSFVQSFIIGCWQCLALIPGMSRSASSIIGGMQQKLTRNAAAEFSFFLAVPTMLAATGYKLLKHYKEAGGFTTEEIKLLSIGNVLAFVVAMLAIKFFIGFLSKHGFRIWGIYRIVVGIALLILLKTGYLAA